MKTADRMSTSKITIVKPQEIKHQEMKPYRTTKRVPTRSFKETEKKLSPKAISNCKKEHPTASHHNKMLSNIENPLKFKNDVGRLIQRKQTSKNIISKKDANDITVEYI